MNVSLKREIRKQKQRLRSLLSQEEVNERSRAAAKNFLESPFYRSATQLMLYMPIGNEMNPAMIAESALRDQKVLVYPVTDETTLNIMPFCITPETQFRKGGFSVLEPVDAEIADMSRTDVILVPGVAFDRTGGRIGFGKGCYDRLLRTSSAMLIGLCYEFQICDSIPTEEHDVKMHYLLTENGCFSCGMPTSDDKNWELR